MTKDQCRKRGSFNEHSSSGRRLVFQLEQVLIFRGRRGGGVRRTNGLHGLGVAKPLSPPVRFGLLVNTIRSTVSCKPTLRTRM